LEILEEFIQEDDTEKITLHKQYNDRVPRILRSNQLMEKLFTKGWKLDLFNQQGFINKQIAAIAVIFALF